MQQKGQKKSYHFVFWLAETAALRCANLPGSPQIHSSFFPPTFSNSEAVLKSAIGRHRICTACISVLGIHPPAPKPKQKKLINTNKAKQFRRSHAEKESQPDRQTPPVHFDSFHEDAAAGAKLAFTAFMDRCYHAMLTAPYDRIY